MEVIELTNENSNELINQSSKELKKLIDCLGFDGEFYVSNNNPIILFSKDFSNTKFLTAKSKVLVSFMEKYNITDKDKKYFNNGVIILAGKGKSLDELDRDDLLDSINHERLHLSRMILLNTQINQESYPENSDADQNKKQSNNTSKDSDNKKIYLENSIMYDDGHLVQINGNNEAYYADISQDIIKGSIDNADITIKQYENMKKDDLEDILFFDNVSHEKLKEQNSIDETLVPIMAEAAVLLDINNSDDLMRIIRIINKNEDHDDIIAMTNIILRHNDLELLRWMIDPLSYQVDDINYDYFKHYITEEDMEDYKTVINSKNTEIDDDRFDELIIQSRHR